MAKRQFIFDQIRKVFQLFGFQPLETPAMENLSTLTGKYGEEGDQLLFKILDSGDYIREVKKLIEIDPVQNSRVGDLLREFSRDLRSNLNSKNISTFSYENLDRIADEIKSLNSKFDFSKSSFASYLKGFIENNPEYLAYIIIKEPKSESASTEPMALMMAFLLNTNAIADRIKSEFESRSLVKYISEKGLRYDLTVPFARYVVMNRNDVSFPFKRYQMQPVWRADRPQKGRYREFYQCDADVVGTNSLICEVEIILMIKETFKRLGITDYTIKFNHRGVLNGVAESIGAKGNETSLFVAIDKLDKIGEDKVKEELLTKGFTENNLKFLFDVLKVKGSIVNRLTFLASRIEKTECGLKGLHDIREVLNLLESYGDDGTHLEFDVSLARGLSYYTGCIFEVKINNVSIGSVSGGGRYDNLTQAFGDKENLSGVGFSFGVDRIYDAMEELNLFPREAQLSSKVLICHLDEESKLYGLSVTSKLRAAGITAEVYPDSTKLKKQLDYANKKMIPFTIVIGSEEVKSGALALKNMERGEQEKLSIDNIIQKLQ
ncbi:MAG: histidine--tRNA ligase [Bacteroidota bacterium]